MSDQSDALEIAVTPGPFKVSGAKSLRFAGQDVPVEGDLYLCRCGASKKPPYCDGTHGKIGFDGKNQLTKRKPLVVWNGQHVSTTFNPNVCMHAGSCKPLGKLREEQEQGNLDAAAEIARVVRSCPSGALSYAMKPGTTSPVAQAPDVDIDVREGGEIRIQRTFTIDSALNEAQPNDRAALCRCGKSLNKPYCNGAHAAKKDFK